MKNLWTALHATVLVAGVSATKGPYGAYLWTIDHGSTHQAGMQVQSITSEVAENILVSRKGLPETAYRHPIDDDSLTDVARYGGYQQPLFSTGKERSPDRLQISTIGYTGSVSEFDTLPDIWVEHPSKSLQDIFESKVDVESVCEYHIVPPQRQDVSIRYTYTSSGEACRTQREIERSPSLLVVLSTIPQTPDLPTKITSFYRNLLHLRATSNVEVTFLVLPPGKYLSAPKRANSKHHAELRRRAEIPLEEAFPQLDLGTLKSNSSHNNHTNTPLPKHIPQCFSSLDACNNGTNACSGHGKCTKKSANCYKCSCIRTTVRAGKNGESGKTILWGGNACQKKDISTEFNLFAGVGIALFTLAAAGVGVLFRMGAQELPSVIGAGVVGPRAQK